MTSLILWFIILLLFSMVTSSYSITHGTILKDKFQGFRTVHDVVHEHLPNLESIYSLYDWLLLIFIFPLLLNWSKYDKRAFFTSAMRLMIPILFIYCLVTSLTITGPTTDHSRDFGGPLRQAVFGHGSLLLISGHCCFVFALILLMKQYKIISNMTIWGSLAALFALFASMSRSHYTIDPIFSAFVVTCVYDVLENESATLRLVMS